MTQMVVDDHLLRDVLTGDRPADLGGIASSLATTGSWLFRLTSAWATPERVGKLTAPVAALPAEQQDRFAAHLVALPPDIDVLPLRELAWPMARLQHRHRAQGRQLSAAMVEALAAAHALGAAIAVSRHDLGPNLKAAAEHDSIGFTSCNRSLALRRPILPPRPARPAEGRRDRRSPVPLLLAPTAEHHHCSPVAPHPRTGPGAPSRSSGVHAEADRRDGRRRPPPRFDDRHLPGPLVEAHEPVGS